MDNDLNRLSLRFIKIVSSTILLLFGVVSTSALSAQTTTDKTKNSESAVVEAEVTANPLNQLEWLVGEWAAKGDGYQACSTAKWSENRKFIVSQFTVDRPGAKTLCGTQRIGWDPATEGIRSWVFDSEGGISEGIWQQEGDAWVVKNVGVLPDGRRSTAANFLVREGDDRYVIKTSHIKVDDETVADFEIEFRRVRRGR
jgi:hypothetical protein